jgi:NAD(P)-dependent dehydrogenase (short-subunit alcohol dehydrogenase family)
VSAARQGAGPLAGRGAVVTGGGRGIGAAIAETLAGAGAGVVVTARTEDEIESVAAALRARGTRAFAVACDVSHEESVRRLGEAARRHLKSVDILVNSAGVGASAPLRKIALAEWDLVMAANATSAFLCSREFVPAMVGRKWGRVVNIASIAGLEGAKYVSHYSASKHAVVGFTRSVAQEVAGSGVTVNAICPAYVDTPMTEITIAEAESRTGLTRAEALAKVLATTGQERLIAPAEVAKLVLDLCGEERSHMNGRSIVMNPGAAGMSPEVVNPESLGKPKGFSHGVLAPRKGRLLFVAGQPGWENDNPGEAARLPRAVRARARQGAHGGVGGRGQAHRRGAHGVLRHRSRRLSREPSAPGGDLEGAARQALPGDGAGRGARARGQRSDGRDRGHRGRDRKRIVTLAPKSFLYAVNREHRRRHAHAQPARAPERAHLRGLCRAARHVRGTRYRARSARDRLDRRRTRLLLGGDVEDIIGALFARDAQGLREFTRMTCDVILHMRRCRRPVIAALNGTVAGAGAVIAAACDFRIAAESAKIAFLFVRVGLSGADMGASWLLPRHRRARATRPSC